MKSTPHISLVVLVVTLVLVVLVVNLTSSSPLASGLVVHGAVVPAAESCGSKAGTWTCNTPIAFGDYCLDDSCLVDCMDNACKELGDASSGDCQYYMTGAGQSHPAAGDTPQEQCSAYCKTLSNTGAGNGDPAWNCFPSVTLTNDGSCLATPHQTGQTIACSASRVFSFTCDCAKIAWTEGVYNPIQ